MVPPLFPAWVLFLCQAFFALAAKVDAACSCLIVQYYRLTKKKALCAYAQKISTEQSFYMSTNLWRKWSSVDCCYFFSSFSSRNGSLSITTLLFPPFYFAQCVYVRDKFFTSYVTWGASLHARAHECTRAIFSSLSLSLSQSILPLFSQ